MHGADVNTFANQLAKVWQMLPWKLTWEFNILESLGRRSPHPLCCIGYNLFKQSRCACA
eukprot:SAG31_NODE_2922_length_4906_cov_8.279800_2_plen_59_part_00